MARRSRSENVVTRISPEQIIERRRSEELGRMVAIKLEYGNFDAARAVIDLAERECRPQAVRDPMRLALAELEIDVRTVNALERRGLRHVGDIIPLCQTYLLAIEQMGPATLEKIDRALADVGLRRRELDRIGAAPAYQVDPPSPPLRAAG